MFGLFSVLVRQEVNGESEFFEGWSFAVQKVREA